MIVVIVVWVMAWLVQAGVVKTPKWARDWSGEPAHVQQEYAAALMTSVCVVFFLFILAGIIQMRRANI